jgi:hypothetical protein
MGGSLAMWNVTNGCAPTLLPFAAGADERARGRVIPSQSRTALVTSRGALVRIDASGNCAAPLEGVRRVDGSFATEPTGGAGTTATWIVADATHLHALQVEGTHAVTELSGYPALLPQGRSVRVPAARDADGRFVVVDNTGEVHVYERGTRRALGTVGAPAAAGPLLVGESQPALVVVATTDGQVVAVEGGGRPATSGWHREAGDERGRAHASCAQVRAETMLALFAFLGVRRRRRCR